MKNQINFFTLFILFALFSSQALGNNIDSCYTLLAPDTLCCNEDIFDSTNSSLDTCSLVPNKQNMVLESTKTQTLINKYKTNIRKLTTNQQQKQYVFWGSLWSAVKNVFDFVTAPVSPVWGAYEEKGQNTAAPLALFKRSTFAQDKAAILSSMSNSQTDAYKIYEKIFSIAIGSPGGWGAYRGQAPNAAYAKCGAFVLLMGVNNTGAKLSATDSTNIANNVYSILNSCFSNTPNDWFEGGDWWQSFGFDLSWIDWDDVHQYRSKDLINYCIAHDLMRTAGYTNLETGRKQIKKYATELYWQATDNFSSMSNIINNNLVLMTAAALATAAMVCNMETDYLWMPWRHPNRWVNKSFARINQTMFTSWTHTESEKGGVYGYREGPGYYAYAMENLMPMFVMFNNYVNENETFSALYPENHALSSLNIVSGLNGLGTLGLANLINTERVKNFLHDGNWENTWIWYTDQVQANGTAITYDDTKVAAKIPMLASTKKQQFSLVSGDNLLKLFSNDYNDRPDFLAANNMSNGKNKVNLYRNRVNVQSGNIMFRTLTKDTIPHYLHALAEPFPGVLESIRLGLGYKYVHEHSDAMSFTISAGNEMLAIDPPYIGYEFRSDVNVGHVHNLITVDGYGPNYTDFPTIEKYDEINKTVELKNTYKGAMVTRKIKVYTEAGTNAPYYEIIDAGLTTDMSFHKFRFNLNGNGHKSTGSCHDSLLQSQGIVVWDYPCKKGRNWGLYAKVTTNNPISSTVLKLTDNHKHGDEVFSQTQGNIISDDVLHNALDFKYSYHSRLEVEQTSIYALYHTIIKPISCAEISTIGGQAEKGKVKSAIDSVKTITVVSNIGDDNRSNIHIALKSNTNIQTINNPLLIDGNGPYPDMELQATHGFLSFSPDSVFSSDNCISYTKFRGASMDLGKLLKYHDTTYIGSNNFADVKYIIISKHKYSGYCKTNSNITTVNFYLPDLEQGIKMVAKGNISSYSYDTNTFIMTVVFPANTTTNFRFEMADPCKINCFYPDTNNHITNTFVQAGRDEYMPYKLKILQPNGQLIMADGAKMHICEFKWLNNRDSLIMVGKEGNYEGLPLTCQKNVIAERALNLDNGRTAIIVGNNASLVLDSGSYTHVGANSSIYVLPGGTLIVKPHAVLEIGSDDAEGYGEILADRGANVCVSPGAIIKFHRNDLDSTDKNRFYVYINDFTQPTALNKTEPAISSAIEQMLYNDTLINAPGNNNCQPFCNFNTILPPHGIINRDWGYAPFVVPRATFKVAGDTLCPGDSVVINLRKVLNESGYRFSVCRVQDTLKTTPCLLGDTNAILKDYIQLSDGCSEKMLIPEELKFLLWDSGWYRIKVEVINECGINHDTTKYVYVPAPPDIVINMPDSICPGVGTLIADGSQTQSYRTRAIYKWTALLVVPDSIRMQEKGIDYGGDWGEFDSTAVTNSFNFPDFRFYGGFKYAIGLSVKGWCGWVTKWDTVNVPLAAYIKSRLATNYQNPIGPSAFELKGYVTGATSYAWSPTTYLDEPDSLTTIARPDQPITYILSATDGGVCYDYDTMHVAHNEVAYAGENALLCFNEKQILGTGYNAFTMLALMAYFNEAEFDAIYPDAFTPTQYYFNRFMLDNISGFYFNKLANDTALQRYFLTNSQIASVMQNCFESNYQADAFSNEIKKMIAQDRWLAAHLVSNNYLQIQSVVAPILSDFAGWMQNNILGYPIAIAGSKLAIPIHPASIEIVWETLQDNSWVEIPAYRNSYNMLQTHAKGGEYRITVLNPSTNSVEYDQVSVIKDTTINVAFMPSFMIDSTVWFTNVSAPVNNRTIYNWYFGDGSHSNLKHPNHTFPSKDSTYIICLTATNECDSFTYCDTLTLDSNGMFFTFGKKGNDPIVLQEKPTDVIKQLSYHRAMNKLSVNQPNPFSDRTTIEYQLMEGYGEAEIRISNTLGQAIKTIKLKGNRGFTTIDGSQWRAGLYHYSLIIDGMIIDSKVMAVGR